MIDQAPASMIARLNEGSHLSGCKPNIQSLRVRHVRCSELSLATVDWTSVDSLLRGTEAGKVLDH
jgi:hypothetical protein